MLCVEHRTYVEGACFLCKPGIDSVFGPRLNARTEQYHYPLQNTTPTCYVFPVPEAPSLSLAATTFAPVPFVAFVSVEGGAASSSSRREPGFLLVTAWGRALYWGSTSAALSGLDKHVDQDIGLAQGEVVRAMKAISVGVFDCFLESA